MNPTKEEVETFIYEGGDDKFINFNKNRKSEEPPKRIPKAFITKLKLKNGKTINAPREWRVLIWEWWYGARKDKIETNVLMNYCNQTLGRIK